MRLENTQLVCQRRGVVRQWRGFVSRDQSSFPTRAAPIVVRIAFEQYYLSDTNKTTSFKPVACGVLLPKLTAISRLYFLSKARCEIVELTASKSDTRLSAYHLNPRKNHHPCFDQLVLKHAWYC